MFKYLDHAIRLEYLRLKKIEICLDIFQNNKMDRKNRKKESENKIINQVARNLLDGFYNIPDKRDGMRFDHLQLYAQHHGIDDTIILDRAKTMTTVPIPDDQPSASLLSAYLVTNTPGIMNYLLAHLHGYGFSEIRIARYACETGGISAELRQIGRAHV